MTPDDNRPREARSDGVRRRGEPTQASRDLFHTWGQAFESSVRRPAVVPADPEAPGKCLCGEPADFVVETNWFSGRHSKDPVCNLHVDEVVRAIKKEQARRNGG
jgi:hypothetical protein